MDFDYLRRTERPEQRVSRIGCTIILAYLAIVGTAWGAVEFIDLYKKREQEKNKQKLEKRVTPDFNEGVFFDE